MYLYILISTAVIYYVLILLDEKRNMRLHNPPPSLGMKITFLFFAFIISTVVIHWLVGSSSYIGEGGGSTEQDFIDVENKHLKHIIQEVEVGLPQF